jgi:hypothetical protein
MGTSNYATHESSATVWIFTTVRWVIVIGATTSSACRRKGGSSMKSSGGPPSDRHLADRSFRYRGSMGAEVTFGNSPRADETAKEARRIDRDNAADRTRCPLPRQPHRNEHISQRQRDRNGASGQNDLEQSPTRHAFPHRWQGRRRGDWPTHDNSSCADEPDSVKRDRALSTSVVLAQRWNRRHGLGIAPLQLERQAPGGVASTPRRHLEPDPHLPAWEKT